MNVWVWYGLSGLFAITAPLQFRRFWRMGEIGRCIYWLLSATGVLCNFLAIALNGNRMPVKDWDSIRHPLMDGLHRLATSQDRLVFLTDVHHLGFARYSLGDVFIMLGLVLWILLCWRDWKKAKS